MVTERKLHVAVIHSRYMFVCFDKKKNQNGEEQKKKFNKVISIVLLTTKN